MEEQNRVLKFPKGFLWGTATSAHQVEGGNKNNDWWQWEQGKDRITDGTRCGNACNHYHTYKSDFDIAQTLGHNAHRFSLEWSRIEPKPGEWSQEAIEHYQSVISALKQRGMTPIITLSHFTLPLWAAEMGGFENPEIIALFKRYAARVSQEFGRDIEYWLSLSEPMVYLYMGYILKKWPPGKNIGLGITKVLNNLLSAHCAAYEAIHQAYQNFKQKPPLVGLTKYIRIFQPQHKNPLDKLAASIKNYLFNDYILGRIKDALDFIGLDYYTREATRFNILKPGGLLQECKPGQDKAVSDLGWEIYPKGIYLSLLKLKKYRLPIIITENGLADKEDTRRSQFIIDHLSWVHRAIEEGVDVRGYLHWSLLDNFEWAEGFGPRFGLIEVDYASQKRSIRPSAYAFAKICKTNQIS